MSQNLNPARLEHHHTHSLDLTESLERTDVHRQYRQQFLEKRAKFNHTQALPPTPKAVKDLFSDDATTLCSTTSTSSTSLDDENALPHKHEKSRSGTPISELIQRFTSELLNHEISSLEPQSQSSVKQSLEFKSNDNTQVSCKLTACSHSQSPTISSSAFKENTTRCDTVKQTGLSVPLKSVNLVKLTDTSFQHGVALRRPSDFYRLESHDIKSTEPLSEQSLMKDTDTAASFQMLPSLNIDSVVLGTIEHTPEVARTTHVTTAIPFRPPNWVKFPKTSTDETDATPSSSSVNVTESSTESSVVQPHLIRPPSLQSYVARPNLTRASSIQSNLMTEGSTSSEAPTSSLLLSKNLGTIEHTPEVARTAHVTTAIPFRPPNWVKFPKTSTDETDATPSSSSVNVTESSTESSVVQPHLIRPPSFQFYVAQPNLTRASSFQSYLMTEGSTSSEAPASSLLLLNNQELSMSDMKKEQNSSSERIMKQSIPPNKALNIILSSCKPSTSSVNLISNRKSPNADELSNSHFRSSVKFVRRSSTSALSSFPRRSQMPTIPVKLLVRKFSENN
ncbi:hypothetical protein L798_03569 [Zootermopsis nevadensis]|uniref:Uncharacterized protein n=1 Tax=Zootermopsis nevadensis TaxID=136037 RepID=A0A067QG01_ZOONE|nr:hypothetical protein L798_03569 [Zootermopsis nevadensis]